MGIDSKFNWGNRCVIFCSNWTHSFFVSNPLITIFVFCRYRIENQCILTTDSSKTNHIDMRFFTALLLGLCLSFTSFGQTGIDCNLPMVINVPVAGIFSSCGTLNNYDSTDACNNNYMNGDDFVFSYAATAGDSLFVVIGGSTADMGIFLTDACPDGQNTVCMATDTVMVGDTLFLAYSFPTTGTYYLTVATQSGCTPFIIGIDTTNYLNGGGGGTGGGGGNQTSAIFVDTTSFSPNDLVSAIQGAGIQVNNVTLNCPNGATVKARRYCSCRSSAAGTHGHPDRSTCRVS